MKAETELRVTASLELTHSFIPTQERGLMVLHLMVLWILVLLLLLLQKLLLLLLICE